jgi:hypothetical protein
MSNGAQYALPIDVGLALTFPMQLCQDEAGTPVDLTGATITAAWGKPGGTPVALTVDVVDAEQGTIVVSATAELTAAATADTVKFWNLIMNDSLGVPIVLMRGPVELSHVL